MSIPALFRHLVHDAAVFPPGEAPLPDAVRGHAAYRNAAYADLVGPFVIGTAALPRLAGLARADLFPTGLPVSVVVPGPDAVRESVAAVDDAARLVLTGLEVKTGDDPVADVAAIASATAGAPSVPTYVEVPRPTTPHWPAVADAVRDAGLRLKFRTGGTEASAFPTEGEVAAWIGGAVARGVPFKCTAGLHNAVRHTDRTTRFEHHGYLNVLVATARACAGAGPAEVAATLGERDAETLAHAVIGLTDGEVRRTRAAFDGYGSCSVAEPLADLTDLRLLAVEPAA